MNTMRQDFTEEERLLIDALTALCRAEADALDRATAEYEDLRDTPAYLRSYRGKRLLLHSAYARVQRAQRALEERRDSEARWLQREVGEA